MFRYDRPQAGRYRQFWQWDVEAIGDAGPAVDAELIELGARFYREAGLADVEVRLNSIGDPACRPAYLAALARLLRGRAPSACRTSSGARLETNPLRLLDSKDPAMAALNAERAADHRPPVRAVCRALRRRPGASRRARHRLPDRARRSCAASTTTRGPRSSSTRAASTASSRRWAAAAATTASSSCSAAGRRPASASRSGSTGSSLALEAAGAAAAAAEPGPLAVVVGADPAATERAAAGRDDAARGGARGPGPTSASRKLGRQLEGAVRDGAHFAVILGDELADGEVQLRDLQAGTQRLVAARRPRPRAPAGRREPPPRRGRPGLSASGLGGAPPRTIRPTMP